MKIYTLKMKNFTALLFILFLFVCTIFGTLTTKAAKAVVASAEGETADGVQIIIDAGHGGEDGGASSASGILEKDVNLKIALILDELLTISGYETVMIRDADTDLGDPSLSTVRERKNSDLHQRNAIVQETENAVLISIHQNFFEQSQYSGAQIFYSENHEKSKELAEFLRSNIVTNTQPDNTRELKPSDNSIYLLREAYCPAVIVECGFLSNPEEAEKLSTEDYQNKIAFSIYEGICDFLAEN